MDSDSEEGNEALALAYAASFGVAWVALLAAIRSVISPPGPLSIAASLSTFAAAGILAAMLRRRCPRASRAMGGLALAAMGGLFACMAAISLATGCELRLGRSSTPVSHDRTFELLWLGLFTGAAGVVVWLVNRRSAA